MGQCFGRCCTSNRSQVQPKRSDSTINLTCTEAWIEPDGIKDDTGDKSNNPESLTLDEDQTAVEHVQPSGSSHDEIDGELEQMTIKSKNQDQNSHIIIPAHLDHTSENQYGRDLIDVPEERGMIVSPNGFEEFIRKVIVPTFERQRRCNQKQFAILLLVTKEDLSDINQMKFHPHDSPITNNYNLSMPDNEKDYHNYIVARPRNDNHHAEKEIFEHLDQLWKGFVQHNRGIPPKCFILYSWNFPCSKCTNLIISSFNKPLYKSVSVIIAATAKWDKEEHEVRHQNEEKMKREQFCVTEYYRGIKLPDYSSNNDSYTDSYSDDSSEL